jgi:hypothetical protein
MLASIGGSVVGPNSGSGRRGVSSVGARVLLIRLGQKETFPMPALCFFLARGLCASPANEARGIHAADDIV